MPRITVIGENEEFVALLADIFDAQFEVTAARDASLNGIGDTRPQLLIVNVPGVSSGGLTGWEIVRLARWHRDLCAIPIVLCTSGLIALDRDDDRLAGFTDVHLLSMPFALEVIEDLVDRLLPRALLVKH
jgi:CheY-like chemotaxis protein